MPANRLRQWQNFYNAVRSLVLGDDPLRERLVRASHSLIALQPDEVDEKYKVPLAELLKELTAVEARGDEGNLTATIRVMPEDRVHAIADKILSMFVEICKDWNVTRKTSSW